MNDKGPAAPIAGGSGEDTGLEEYADRIAEEMHERVERQRAVIRRILSAGACRLEEAGRPPRAEGEELRRMKAALRETIEVLEETKSSFKAKRLEVLRKRLLAVLAGD